MRLPGFKYDSRRRRATFDVYVSGRKGKVRRRKTVENVLRDEALEAWRAFRLACNGKPAAAPATFREFVEAYYPLISASLAPSTVATQRVITRAHLLRYFGDVALIDITSIRVVDFKADMRSRNLSAAYINDAVRLLKTLMRQAVERDVIPEYPLKKKITNEPELLPELELSSAERVAFLHAFEDEAQFRAHLATKRRLGPIRENPNHRPRRHGGGMQPDGEAAGRYFRRFQELREFFVLALETGIRLTSDLRNLTWRDVHIDHDPAMIRIVMKKTRRDALVPVSKACAEALSTCRARAKGNPHVFVDERGIRYSPTRIRRAFLLAKSLACITRRFRPHDLRHTFASRLASRGVSLQLIAKSLGHTSTKMAERYARPSKAALQRVADALDADTVSAIQRSPQVTPFHSQTTRELRPTFRFIRGLRTNLRRQSCHFEKPSSSSTSLSSPSS